MVFADAPATRVDRGDTLVKFLRLFEPATRGVSSAELAAGPDVVCDVAFVGLPTQLSPAGLGRLRATRVVRFDYFDEPWPDVEAPALDHAGVTAGLGTLHLKTHRERVAPSWATSVPTRGLTIGLLPIRYNKAVASAWRRHRAGAPWRAVRHLLGRKDRPWDVSLHGSVTFLQRPGPDGNPVRYEQRIDWMRELRAEPAWAQWGALHPLPYRTVDDVVHTHGASVAQLFDDGPKLGFGEYFARVAATKVALCPSGHARWTYRHVEAVYAGCEVVSTDLTGIDTLLPAPVEAMTLVPDHAAIRPAVQAALDAWDERSLRRDAAVAHLEGWLDAGRFARGRRRPFEAFEQQLGAP